MNALQNETAGLDGRRVWLTSFWGFAPEAWGCVGFSDAWRRDRFLKNADDRTLFAVYVTKGRGPEKQRGKVVGVLEISTEMGHIQNFLSGDAWAEKEADPDSRGKWEYAVRATRAWVIDEAEWTAVEEIFPNAYGSSVAQAIGANGVEVSRDEVANIGALTVYEVPVYGQTGKIDSAVRPLSEALSPSRAVMPAKEPFFVGEVDGPKHLYVLRLEGGVSEWLGQDVPDFDTPSIIKVGFSKSPTMRRDQIQSAYPSGKFSWTVHSPDPIPQLAPFPNASIAIVGEDAMKARLVKSGAKSLGGEFFLADDWMIQKCWVAGKLAAETAMEEGRS